MMRTRCAVILLAAAFHCSTLPEPAIAGERPEIFVQMGHTGNVTCAVFTPDGKYLLSGSVDKTMKLWDVATGKELRTFSGPTDRIAAIAVSPDGKYAVSGDEDFVDNLKLWELSSGKQVKTFGGHVGTEGTTCVVFCPDGKHILSGGDSTVKLWDIASGKELRTMYGNGYRIRAIAISPDGRTVVAGSRNNSVTMVDSLNADGTLYESRQVYEKSAGNTILVWDVASGRLLRGFNHARGWVHALAMTPNGAYVISGDFEDSARMWEVASGREIKSFKTEGASSIAISPDGNYTLLGGVMEITLWNIAAGEQIRKFEGLHSWVRSVAFSRDRLYARVLSADDSRAPQLWDIASGRELQAFGGSTQQVASVTISADGKKLFVAQSAGSIKIWDIASGRQTGNIRNNLGMETIATDGDGTVVGAGGWDFSAHSTTVKCWNTATGKELSTITREGDYWARSLAISPDRKRAFWTDGPTVVVSDLATGKELRTCTGIRSEIYHASMSSDGKTAVAGDPRQINIWDIETGNVLKTYSAQDGSLRMCSNGRRALVISSDDSRRTTWQLWDLQSNKEVMSRTNDRGIGFRSVAMSPDGKYVVSSDRWTMSLWDIAKGKELRTFPGHTNTVTSVGMSPDQTYLYSGSDDGTTRFWDVATGRELARFVGFTDGEWVVITPEGYFNASANGASHLNVRVGNDVYSIDNFYEKFFNPVLVASVLQGKRVQPVADIRKGFLAPPEVNILSPESGKEFRTDVVTVSISAKDMGGGIDEIRLYQNGKAIGEETRGMKVVPVREEAVRSYTVTLVDGVNTFRATAFSRDRTESNPVELTVKLAAPQKDVSLYLLAVGINTYKNPALNLNYAEPDARGIVDFFRKQGKGLFKSVESNEMYNAQAVKETIVANLEQLQNTHPQDVVLIYLAGHGESINDKWYFIPYELTYPERQEEITAKAISSDELRGYVNKIKAQKILLLIDACKSGAVVVAFRGFEDRKALSQLSRSTGMYVVAASAKDQFAAEVKELGHGVFTYVLLEGLKGRAAMKGEPVTVLRLISYISEQLPVMTKKYNQEEQYPVMGSSQGMDFPLVMAK